MSAKVAKKSTCPIYKEPTEKPPCHVACPVGIDIPRHLRLISQGRLTDALAVVLEKLPFPSVCGRVCPAPCEIKCRLGKVDGAMPIMALKRFATEQASIPIERKVAKSTGKQIAVIGSGPAGLTAAYYLAKLGHIITVFDELSEPGGMMRVGIPEYHLPRKILDADIIKIVNLGIQLRLNTRVENIANLVGKGYDAIFLALGAQEAIKLAIPGADLSGVLTGLSFLKDVNQGKKVKIGKEVLVLGGGGVAIDAARAARRLGAKVAVACLESKQTMPALPEQIEGALEEGIAINPSRSFIRIVQENGHAVGVECLKLRWAKFDQDGGLHLSPIPGSEHILKADTIILAVGQRVDPELVSEVVEIKISRRRTIIVDPSTVETGYPGVFAGGDVVIGPASVIEAIAAGRKAASFIDRYLGGIGVIEETLAPAEETVMPLKPLAPLGQRAMTPSLPLDERLSSFAEVELSFAEPTAIEQAGRCLRCDLPIIADASKCAGCMTCMLRCSFRLDDVFNLAASRIQVSRLLNQTSEFGITFAEECDACGICVRYCPYDALTRQKIGKVV